LVITFIAVSLTQKKGKHKPGRGDTGNNAGGVSCRFPFRQTPAAGRRSTRKSKRPFPHPQGLRPADSKYMSRRKKSSLIIFLAAVIFGTGAVLPPGGERPPSDRGPVVALARDAGRQGVPAAAGGGTTTMAHAAVTAPPGDASPPGRTVIYGYRVVRTYPHDPRAFTQGLAYAGGRLYEGTGREGGSSLRRVELHTGRVLQEHRLESRYFGEGITLWKDRIYQLTWRSRQGFIYDRETFRSRGGFRYDHEGWGITHDGKRFIVSDGSETLRFYDPAAFREQGRITVRDERGVAVAGLNELEYVRGMIWANVWPTDVVVIIDPRTGRVRGWLDLTGLLPPAARRGVDVLNGIAYDAAQDRFFVTGKYWPLLFEIRIVEK